MQRPVSAPWTPQDDAELTAGWRLWLELGDRAWPNATWDGTPADAVGELLELLTVCNHIEDDFLRESPRKSAQIVVLLRSLFFLASSPVALWRDDDQPLDPQRAELLHADLSCFARSADEILGVLAAGGGWAALEEARRKRNPRYS